MSSNRIDPVSTSSPEWNEAWKSLRRLAGVRRRVIERTVVQHGSSTAPNADHRSSRGAVDPGGDDILFISAQAQHDFAEIEGALAALRHAQPDLEAWSIARTDAVQAHNKPRSVWLVVGAVWISTVLLMAMATFAIASLLS
jgi:hypothetical protein